jgi:hypothetical protein
MLLDVQIKGYNEDDETHAEVHTCTHTHAHSTLAFEHCSISLLHLVSALSPLSLSLLPSDLRRAHTGHLGV